MRARSVVVCVVVAAELMAGCSSAIGGQAAPDDPTSRTGDAAATSGSADLPNSGAPQVPDPLDQAVIDKASANGCSTLTDAQVEELRLDLPGRQLQGASGSGCQWSNSSTGSSTGVLLSGPSNVIQNGLSQIFGVEQREESHEYFYLMEPVQDFPVLAADTTDSRDSGSCSVHVGLTDRWIAIVDVRLSRAKRGQLEPCAAARAVADMMVTTMKANAR